MNVESRFRCCNFLFLLINWLMFWTISRLCSNIGCFASLCFKYSEYNLYFFMKFRELIFSGSNYFKLTPLVSAFTCHAFSSFFISRSSSTWSLSDMRGPMWLRQFHDRFTDYSWRFCLRLRESSSMSLGHMLFQLRSSSFKDLDASMKGISL